MEFFRRHSHNFWQAMRFGLVGGSGVLVNMVALVLINKVAPLPDHVFFDLPGTRFNVRWYHVISTLAFFVANLWNFQLNRTWTFKTAKHAAWWREYVPFLAVGLLGQLVGLLMLTALMHDGSPINLPRDVFDDTTGLKTRLYWAQLIVITVITPISFVLNKWWTFRAIRHLHAVAHDPFRSL